MKVGHRRILMPMKWKGLRLLNLALGRTSVHFLHPGKTGGTAVKHAIRHHEAARRFRIHLHPHSFRLRDVPRGDKVFFFVRDPVDRFVSGFYSRLRKGQPTHFYEWSEAEKTAFDEFETPNGLALALSSEDPARKARAQIAMRQIAHVRDSYWDWFEDERYLRFRLPDILFIGFQERLTEDFEILKSLIRLPDAARLPDDDKLAHRGPPGLDKTLEDAAISNLESWYEADIRFVELCRDLSKKIALSRD